MLSICAIGVDSTSYHGVPRECHSHSVSHPGDDKLLSNNSHSLAAVAGGFPEDTLPPQWLSACQIPLWSQGEPHCSHTLTTTPRRPKTHWICNVDSEPIEHPSTSEICREMRSPPFSHVALPNQEWLGCDNWGGDEWLGRAGKKPEGGCYLVHLCCIKSCWCNMTIKWKTRASIQTHIHDPQQLGARLSLRSAHGQALLQSLKHMGHLWILFSPPPLLVLVGPMSRNPMCPQPGSRFSWPLFREFLVVFYASSGALITAFVSGNKRWSLPGLAKGPGLASQNNSGVRRGGLRRETTWSQAINSTWLQPRQCQSSLAPL